jgi:hypothetical protein
MGFAPLDQEVKPVDGPEWDTSAEGPPMSGLLVPLSRKNSSPPSDTDMNPHGR